MPKRLTIGDCQRYARKQGGRCLSKEYVSRDVKLKWECKNRHQWAATTLSVVMSNHWCPKCAAIHSGKARLAKGRLAELKHVAKSRDGECISPNYLGMHKALNWRCYNGHTWSANPSDIMRGGWCPDCSSGVGERICRAYFEQLFGTRFPRSRLQWLVNESGNRMEIDGYSAKLKLGFEHHGSQHYTIDNPYVTSGSALAKRRAADSLKRQLCRQQNVTLIEVPEVPTKTSLTSLRSFIGTQCKMKGVCLPKGFETKQVNLKRAYSPSFLDEMKSLARMRGGWCLSNRFSGWHRPLQWQCEIGHQWEASPTSIKHQGTWCFECRVGRRYSLADMRRIAAERGGKCTSRKYEGVDHKLGWQCSKGHNWNAIPGNVIQGHWCSQCAGCKRGSIEEMQRIAAARGGKCRSKFYVNSRTKLEWECSVRHVWNAIPLNVKNKNSWCRICAFRRLSLSRRSLRNKSGMSVVRTTAPPH